MERVAIPLLFFPIGLLKLCARLGFSDTMAILSTVVLTAVCLIGFFLGLFTPRPVVRWLWLLLTGLILVSAVVGWHWSPDSAPISQPGRSGQILGPPSDD